MPQPKFNVIIQKCCLEVLRMSKMHLSLWLVFLRGSDELSMFSPWLVLHALYKPNVNIYPNWGVLPPIVRGGDHWGQNVFIFWLYSSNASTWGAICPIWEQSEYLPKLGCFTPLYPTLWGVGGHYAKKSSRLCLYSSNASKRGATCPMWEHCKDFSKLGCFVAPPHPRGLS